MNNKRLLIVSLLVFAFFFLIAGKLFYIQIIRSDELKYYAQRQQTLTEKIVAERGCIYDREGNLLVYNKNDVSFFVDVRIMKNREKDQQRIAQKFAKEFNRSEAYYINLMKNEKKVVCIEKKVPREKALLLKEFSANGLFSQEDQTRVYEYGSFASHILGYVGGENKGLDGIEKTFNRALAGEDGSRVVLKNAMGQMITVEEEETKPAVAGNNLYLTLNKSYQIMLEEELKNGLNQFGGTSATGILMDPYTGEILAMATKEDFDPNYYWKVNDTIRRNKALIDLYEPGSTFKSVSMAALLDMNLCRPDEQVFTENGVYAFKGHKITDSHKGGWTTVKGVIEESSNIGMAKLIQRIKNDDYYKYVRGFGFGNVTSIKLPAENKGSLKNPSSWDEISKATMSYGYSVMVTPLQMVTAYAALVNGGTLLEPQLVKKQVDNSGNTVFESQPKVVRRVISQRTSDIIKDFLVGVVENGTAKTARVEGLKMGGKTGTSMQCINGKYSKQHYNTSFVGFFPADNPKIVGIILVSAPVNSKYGGTVAAPIFKNVAKRIFEKDGGEFRGNKGQNGTEKQDSRIKPVYVSNNIKNDAKTVEQVFSEKNILTKRVMPDLKKMTSRDAIIVLTRLGVQYKVKGAGKVVAQSVAPGEKISGKTYCELSCDDFKISGAQIY